MKLPPSRRNFLRLGAAGAAAGVLAWTGHAQQPAPAGVPARPKSGAEFIDEKTQDAIDKGLAALAANQANDGSFPDPGGSDATVGITALAALALMAGGSQPNRGPYGKHVARSVDYVAGMANGRMRGFLTTPDSQLVPLRNRPGPMYSHGFGAMFLSEACGMVPVAARDRATREALDQAVAFTLAAQNADGGWRYEPKAEFSDVSVTTAEMMALRAARNAGFHVPNGVFDRAAAFLKSCQVADGGFVYWKGDRQPAFARSAASLVGLYSAGIYKGDEVDRALKYLAQFTPTRQLAFRELPPGHYWYGHYYAALAMWTAGEDYWTTWFPAIRNELLTRRNADGGRWTDRFHGESYATAMALIILQLPNNYLPILQK
jgi:hypothetical protein